MEGLPPLGSPQPFLQLTSYALVHCGNDRVADFPQLFLMMFKFFLLCNLILTKPVDDFITFVQNLLFILITELNLKFSHLWQLLSYFKEKDVTAQGGNWSHSILGWFSTDFRKMKILSKHLLPQFRVREF